jgi:hypothetical protein
MSEQGTSPNPTSINLPAPEGLVIEQTSTRGDGSIELGEVFESITIDFSQVTDHLAVHTDGQAAGSQFNGELFTTPNDVVESVKAALPGSLQYDQFGRVELTIAAEGSVVGYSGVKPLAELEGVNGVHLGRAMRTPGGEAAEVGGIKGAWFPEMTRNPQTGKFEVVLGRDGSIKNPHGKFEPEAWIAQVDEGALPQALATDKVTVILQKNPENELPVALTIFPGENAPAFPAKIESEAFQADTLQGGPEAAYWAEHAFIQAP